MSIITIAIGVFLGFFVLPFLVLLAFNILMLPVFAFMMISLFLQPVYDFIISGCGDIIRELWKRLNPDSYSEPMSCLNCNKKLEAVSSDDYCSGFNPSKHCSYDCYNDLSNYEYKRSIIITLTVLVLVVLSKIG